VLAAIAIAGIFEACSVVNQVLPTAAPPTADTFETWSAQPLAPSAELLALFAFDESGAEIASLAVER
jgi:hypothetical protein